MASYASQQEAVSQLGQEGLAGAEVVELFDLAVQLVARTLGVDLGAIFEWQPDGDKLRLVAGIGWNEGSVGAVVDADGVHWQDEGAPKIESVKADLPIYEGPLTMTTLLRDPR